MASTYTTLVGAPPAACKLTWLAWYNRLLKARLDSVPLARTTTYYLAANGSDSNTGLTTAAPFLTIAKAQAVLTASSGDVRFRFRRGDTWEEAGGAIAALNITKANVTVDDWWDAATIFKAAPRFSRFLLKYNSTGWALAAGNRYTRAEATTVGWVRYQSDHFDPILIKASSAAVCEATSNSWFWGAGTLHINLGGTNPNALNLEAVADNSIVGIQVTNVDGCRIKNIRIDGFGLTSSLGYTLKVEISAPAGLPMVAVVENCEAYYGGYHLMGHNSGAVGLNGGACVFLNCRAGLGYANGGGATGWVTHALGGQETIWHCCEAAYGTLPDTGWYNATTRPRFGVAIFGHSDGPAVRMGLLIVYGLSVYNNTYGCEGGTLFNGNDCPTATILEDARVFVNEEMVGNQPCGTLDLGILNIVYLNCRYHVTKMAAVSAIQSTTVRGWLINCDLTIENSNVFTNNAAGGPHHLRLWHPRLSFPANLTHQIFYGLTAAQLAGTDPAPSVFNGIIVMDRDFVGTNTVNTRNHANNLGGNAYFAVSRYTDGGGDQGYNADLSAVQLPTPPVMGLVPDTSSALYRTGVALPGGYQVEYDQRWRPRLNLSLPSIGPIGDEYATVGAFLPLSLSGASPSTRQDLIHFKSEDALITVTMSPSVNIATWSLQLRVWDPPDQNVTVLSKTIGLGITITSPTTGVFTIAIASADLAGGTYDYELRRTDSGANAVLAHGKYMVTEIVQHG